MTRPSLLLLSLAALSFPLRADIIGSSADQPSPATDFRLPAGEKAIDEAIALYRQRNLDGCLARLQEASQARPDLGPARLMLAKILLIDNQGAAGQQTLERAASENPDWPDIWLTLAKVALRDGRAAEAAALYDRALALLKRASLPADRLRTLRIDAESGQAQAAERLRDWKAAESAARAWLADNAGSLDARRHLAQALFRQDRRDEALQELERAAALDSDEALPAPLAMALLAIEANEPDTASSWFEKAVAKTPNDLRVRRTYGGFLLDRGLTDGAQKQITAAAGIDSKSLEVRLLQGALALQREEYAEAERILQALHLEAPASFAVNDRWARALAGQDDDAKKLRAAQVAEMNQRLNPNSPEALATRGIVLQRLGRLAEAEQLLRSAVASNTATSEMLYELARLLSDHRPEHPDIPRLLRIALGAPGPFPHRSAARHWLDSLTSPTVDSPASAASPSPESPRRAAGNPRP